MHEHEYTVWAACQHHNSVEIGLGCCILISLARRGKAKQINLKWRSKVKKISEANFVWRLGGMQVVRSSVTAVSLHRYYVCSFCSREFKKPSDLIRHVRIHTQVSVAVTVNHPHFNSITLGYFWNTESEAEMSDSLPEIQLEEARGYFPLRLSESFSRKSLCAK